MNLKIKQRFAKAPRIEPHTYRGKCVHIRAVNRYNAYVAQLGKMYPRPIDDTLKLNIKLAGRISTDLDRTTEQYHLAIRNAARRAGPSYMTGIKALMETAKFEPVEYIQSDHYADALAYALHAHTGNIIIPKAP